MVDVAGGTRHDGRMDRMGSCRGGHPIGGITLVLAGDVMAGRGIDQVMTHPCDPVLYEPRVRNAREYVTLAERASGAIPRAVPPACAWGDALDALRHLAPQAFVVNLETAVTRAGTPWPAKGVHHRMHPAHVGCLTAARVDCAMPADWAASHRHFARRLVDRGAADIVHGHSSHQPLPAVGV